MGEPEIPLQLDREDPQPLAAQLADQLRDAILHRHLMPDRALPSTRRLASDLKVSRGVVVRAFEQLSGEGFLRSENTGGTFVAIRPDLQTPRLAASTKITHSTNESIIDLTPGRPSDTPFQDQEWRHAWRKAVAETGNSKLPPRLGTDALRQAIADHLAVSRGITVEAGDIIVTAGTSDALQLIVAALRCQSGNARILMEDPSYPTARRVIAAAGATVETLPVGDDGVIASQLATISNPPNAILITPSHQYPLGGRMPVQERLKLLEWANTHGVVVLEDDYDSEFRHRRMPLPAVASLPTPADVILLGTFSKSLSPWLRCGYLVVRGKFGQHLKYMREELDTPVSGLMQSALSYYLENGGLSRHITRARREYAHRRMLLIDKLGGRPDLRIGALDGGLHAVLRFQAPAAEPLIQAAAHQGIRVAPLSSYYVSPRAEANGIVIGYGSPSDLQLAHAIDIIDRLLSEHFTATQDGAFADGISSG